MGTARESLDFKEFSHIIPSVRYRKVAGAGDGVSIVVPGAAQGDVLLGVTEDGGLGDYLDISTLEDGELTITGADTTGEFLLVVYFDEDGVLS